MNKIFRYITLLSAVLILAGCHTQQAGQKHRASHDRQVVEKTLAAQPIFQTLDANMQLKLTAAGNSFSSNGRLQAICDSMMVLSVQPMLGIELFRIEFTTAEMRIIDKMNHRYATVAYQEIQQKVGLPITFGDVQALFLNRMFVVGKAQSELVKQKWMIQVVEHAHQLVFEQVPLQYTFLVAPHTYALTQSQLAVGGAHIQMQYVGHELKENIFFPTALILGVNDGQNNEITCEMAFSKVTFNQSVRMRPVNTLRFNHIPVSKLLQL